MNIIIVKIGLLLFLKVIFYVILLMLDRVKDVESGIKRKSKQFLLVCLAFFSICYILFPYIFFIVPFVQYFCF